MEPEAKDVGRSMRWGAFGLTIALAACAGASPPASTALPAAPARAAAPASQAARCVAQGFPSPANVSGVSDAPPCDPMATRGLPAVRPPHVATPPAGETTAWGTLVDDRTDFPLARYAVVLYPANRGCTQVTGGVSCPQPLPWHALTSRHGRFVLPDVPNGSYLLVIGSDSPQDMRRPTIHDLIAFTGGIQRLLAPVLARQPALRPPPPFQSNLPAVPIPAVQKTVLFRLGALSTNGGRRALRCWQDFRTDRALPLGVADEWLLENAAAIDEVANAYTAWGVPAYSPLLSSAADGSPFPPCPAFGTPSEGAFADAEATDPRVLWVGGESVAVASGAVSGLLEWKPDPRVVVDPLQGHGVSAWP